MDELEHKVLGDIANILSPLPASVFSFIFPLIKNVLLRPSTPSTMGAQASAMKIIGMHLLPGPAYPRAEIARVLLHIMHTTPRYCYYQSITLKFSFVNRARGSLITLCTGMSISEVNSLIDGLHSSESFIRETCFVGLKVRKHFLFYLN